MVRIKSKRVIVSNTIKPYGREIVVRKLSKANTSLPAMLSDVLWETPHGIIYKDETGMGATTLEFKAQRNSIIVEPTKITASSKAIKHEALYVGSPTKYHPENLKVWQIKKKIYEYAHNEKIEFKKIVVVADSLQKVIEVLRPDVFDDYFILIDEVDSFQLDSVFRRNMENCLDYYKEFPKKNRGMLSATRVDFSDPDLKGEPITFIKYDTPSKRKINLITTSSKKLPGVTFDLIKEQIKQYPNDKIMLAYNSVTGCYNLAMSLINEGVLEKEEISMLCSTSNEKKLDAFYQELQSDTLPSRLNFITSAYFTGFDLNEQIHLISVSGNRSNVQTLSDRRLKQIAGRSRKGLLSETIIHDLANQGELNKLTIEDLINAAKEEIDSLECLNKHYMKNRILKAILGDINEKFIKLLDVNNAQFIYSDKNKNFKISYLNIDARIELLRVREHLYVKANSLVEKLREDGHIVSIIRRNTKTTITDSKISKSIRDHEIKTIIDQLRNVQRPQELLVLMSKKGEGQISNYQKKIVMDFAPFYGLLKQQDILDRMEECLVGKRDNRKYNSLLASAYIQTLPKGHLFVDRFNFYFKTGKRYTPSEILLNMNLFLAETGNEKTIDTERKATRLLNNFRSTYRKHSKKSGNTFYHIKSDNPFELKVLKKRESLQQNKTILDFLSK